MFIRDGKAIDLDQPLEADGVTFPAGTLRNLPPDELKELGITEIADQPRPDDRFFWVSQNADRTYTATPKDLDQVRGELIALANSQAAGRLAQTDWQVIRKIETEKEVDPLVAAYRAAVRDAVAAYTDAVRTAPFEALMTMAIDWPEPLA